jgi:hypothetical protein
MIMRSATILLSLVTSLSLNLILFLGAVVHDPETIRPFLNGLVMVIDSSLVTSSGLLGFLLIGRNKFLAGLFILNIGIFLVAVVLRLSGVLFPPPLLFAADIYWLNLYVATLARYWPTIAARNP